MFLVETLRRLWFLFLAFFRSKPVSNPVLPMSSNGKTRVVGKPDLLSASGHREPVQRRSSLTSTSGRLAGSHSSYPRSNLQDLPSDGLPSTGNPHWGFSPYSLILPDLPPPRPPRPRSISGTSVSEAEFRTPSIHDVRLPSVIITPCTPSTKASRRYIDTNELDELDSDDNGESSVSDANSYIASVDSNPFLNDPSLPLQVEFNLPPLNPGALNHHRRARSLTGTGRGLQHQPLSRSEHFIRGQSVTSSLPRVTKTGMLANPVKQSDFPLLIGSSVAPSASRTSFIRSRPNVVWDSTYQAITDQRIRTYMTSTSSETSTDQTLVLNLTLDATSVSTGHFEDPMAGAMASCEAQPAALTYTNAMAMDQITAPSNLTPSIHGHAPLSLVPYPEVFDLDAYFDSDSSWPSESTLKSSLNASCSTIDSNESKNPILVPTTPSANCSSSAIFALPPQPLCRISNVSDTTASSTSIYTSTDESTSASTSPNPQRLGFLRITDNGRKSKVTFDHEVKRYRDHYRHPAYSRSPAFVIESPTTSKKFTRKRESDRISINDRANKENESIPSTTTPTTITPTRANLILNTKIANPISSPNSSYVHNRDAKGMVVPRRASALFVRDQQVFKPFRDQMARATYTPDSSTTTTASNSPDVATRHRLGSVAISQRRKT